MPQAFISYGHADIDFVLHLVSSFSELNVPIWVDFQQLIAGDDWRQEINDALNKSDVMILVISPTSINSREVRREWRYWLGRKDKPPILPVLHKLAEIPYELAELHYIEKFSQQGGYDGGLMELITALKRHGFDIEDIRSSICYDCPDDTNKRLLIVEAHLLVEAVRKLRHALILASQEKRGSPYFPDSTLSRRGLGYLLSMKVYHDGLLDEILPHMFHVQQLITGKWLPEAAMQFHQLFVSLKGSYWLEVVITDRFDAPFVSKVLSPDDTLLADLLDSAKNLYAEMEKRGKSYIYPPSIGSKIHDQLTQAGLQIVSVSAFNSKKIETEQPALFVLTDLGYARIDWNSEPSAEDINKAKEIIYNIVQQFWYLKRKE
jgi:hypothetical protein